MSEKFFIESNSTTEWDFYIRGSIENFEDYDDLISGFNIVKSSDSVAIHLNTPGGDCSIGFYLIDKILQIPCPVHMIVEYPTYSMGAIMALCGDALSIDLDSYIMFHDYSDGSHGKGEETAQYVNNYRQVFRNRFTRLCKPFLSQIEINKMFKGEDIYIHHDDPSLENRCLRHFK